MHTEDMMSNL